MRRTLYPIQNDGLDFHAGLTADGRQVLMGYVPGPVAVFFDHDGHVVSFEESPGAIGVAAWQESLGLTPGTIQVRKFSVPGRSIRIEDLPSEYEDLLADPQNWPGDEEDRTVAVRFLKDWDERGMFRLIWGKEYWMTSEGEIEST